LKKWQATIDNDIEVMAENPEQRPLSRAYLSLDPVNKSNNKNVEEEKKDAETGGYLTDTS
jgi:hypothetical protein